MSITERGRWSSSLLTEHGKRVIRTKLTSQGQQVFGVVEPTPTTKQYYLHLTGKTNNSHIQVINSITFDEVIMDFKARYEANDYYFDARTGIANSYLMRSNDNSGEVSPGSSPYVTAMYWNGVKGNNLASFIPYNQRGTLRLVLNPSGTDNVTLFSANSLSNSMEADVYEIKFLLGGTLVAHYDMSLGNQVGGTVQDQSGNGNHASVDLAEWVEVPTTPTSTVHSAKGTSTSSASLSATPTIQSATTNSYYLQMDGIDDHIVIPSMTYNSIELDMIANPDTGYSKYYFDNRTTGSSYVYTLSSGTDDLASNATVYVDDSPVDLSGTNKALPTNTRFRLKLVVTEVTSSITLFSRHTAESVYHLRGAIYGVKVYRGSSLVAHYDMSTQTVLDQVGTNDATLYGNPSFIGEETQTGTTHSSYGNSSSSVSSVGNPVVSPVVTIHSAKGTSTSSASLSATPTVTTAPVTSPVVTVVNVSKTKISDEVGMNSTQITFKFDIDVIEWRVNVLGVSYDSGIVADNGLEVTANTEIVATVSYDELYREGANKVNIYGKSVSGLWTSYQSDGDDSDDIIPPEPTQELTIYGTKTYGRVTYGK